MSFVVPILEATMSPATLTRRNATPGAELRAPAVELPAPPEFAKLLAENPAYDSPRKRANYARLAAAVEWPRYSVSSRVQVTW